MATPEHFSLRDQLKFKEYDEALKFIYTSKENRISISEEWDLRFHHHIRAFVIVSKTHPDMFYPICPVEGCDTYGGAGHTCDHFNRFLLSSANPQALVSCSDNSTALFRDSIDKTGISRLFRILYCYKGLAYDPDWVTGTFHELLTAIEAEPVYCEREQVTVSRHAKGTSLCVKLWNGSIFFTCGQEECFERGDNPRGNSYYCDEHGKGKLKLRYSTNPQDTMETFREAISKLAKSVDPSVTTQTLQRDTWVKVLAKINQVGTYEYSSADITVYLKVSDYGQLSYLNANKTRHMYKCPMTNCLETSLATTRKAKFADPEFLCYDHSSTRPNDFRRIVTEMGKISGVDVEAIKKAELEGNQKILKNKRSRK